MVSQYREDAFGRRVLTHSWWELARRVYFDTRFELDINMDANQSGAHLEYINGGITSTHENEQRAEWESRIYRTHASLESHYYDFLVFVPSVDPGNYTGDIYRGVIGVGDFELRIYHDRYELWDLTGTPTMLDDYAADTAGWHNIGLRAGINAGVWLDGSKIMDFGVGLYVNEKVFFGTLRNLISYMNGEEPATIVADGIELYENLNYLRSYNRSQAEMSDVPGGEVGGYPAISGQTHPPRVKRPFYDGPAAVTTLEIVADSGGSSASGELCTEYEEDGTRARHFFGDGEYTDLYLPNVRRQAALVIRDDADSLVDNEGTLQVHPEEYPLPGVMLHVHFDAIGQPLGYVTPDPFNESFPWGGQGDNVFVCPVYGQDDHTVRLGIGQNLFIDKSTHATSNPFASLVTGDNAEIDQAADGSDQCETGECCFRQHAPNESYDIALVDTPTGMLFNGNRGNAFDIPAGYEFCGGYTGPTVAEVFGDDPEIGMPMGEINGKPITWRPNRGRAVIEGGTQRELEEVAKGAGLPEAQVEIPRSGGCIGGRAASSGNAERLEGVKEVAVDVGTDLAIRVGLFVAFGPLGLVAIMVMDAKTVVETVSNAAEGAKQLAENPEQVAKEGAEALEDPKTQGKAAATVFLVVVGTKSIGSRKGKGGTGGKNGSSSAETAANGKHSEPAASRPKESYNRERHYGRTPKASDRKALGAEKNEVLDHDPPLVKRYYEGDPAIGERPGCEMTPAERIASASDRSRMHRQPRHESNQQGGRLKKYAREKKEAHGLE